MRMFVAHGSGRGDSTQIAGTVSSTSFPKLRRLRRTALGLSLFTGATALAGGAQLIVFHGGAPWLPPLEMLRFTPFDDYLIPGVVLFSFVGLPSIVAAGVAFRRHRFEN